MGYEEGKETEKRRDFRDFGRLHLFASLKKYKKFFCLYLDIRRDEAGDKKICEDVYTRNAGYSTASGGDN